MGAVRFLLILSILGGMASAEPHPRILFPPAMEADVKDRIANDPLAKAIHSTVLERAEEVLEERTCEYLIPDGRRLLRESRRALSNILNCGMAWRTTGDPRFRERVIRELDAAVALKDWNPSHFLDTAEMSAAVAIGYDWLYHSLTEGQRKRYEDALIRKGLQQVERVVGKQHWWARGPRNNWSQVCGSGMGIAAEAVREREPELCAKIADESQRLVEACKAFYLPDGAYPEGPGYWAYGTNYHIMGLAAWQALGRDVDLPAVLGRSGDFMMHVHGPTGLPFNYADGPARRRLPTPAQSWLARQFGDAAQANYVRGELESGLAEGEEKPGGYFPLHLLWLPEQPDADASMPLTASFEGEQSLAFARTGWGRDAAWIGIKGGTGAASHGHLDAGAFVYDAGGVRWFDDLGSDDYNMPGYFGDKRWNYFRLTNHSHNTLVIGGKPQDDPHTGCTIEGWETDTSLHQARIDLTPVYRGQAKSVTRTVTFDAADGSVVIRDEIISPEGPVRWAAVTRAEPRIDGAGVTLVRDGKSLSLTRIDNSGGEWREFSMTPPTAAENQNEGFRMIGFTAEPSDRMTIEVRWEPATD
ncbi:heparinase II/III family protein [Haloferula helveola]|uniref:Heparinase II/III family protein n=1 Tax=Haloferula helveola TaxID=490095 RepID=A0ABM7RFN1_9BACT|nr:heparinase II/III family protein [Haloferula helveola]